MLAHRSRFAATASTSSTMGRAVAGKRGKTVVARTATVTATEALPPMSSMAVTRIWCGPSAGGTGTDAVNTAEGSG